jgi:transcriptional regulator with XRE-family HTH domain
MSEALRIVSLAEPLAHLAAATGAIARRLDAMGLVPDGEERVIGELTMSSFLKLVRGAADRGIGSDIVQQMSAGEQDVAALRPLLEKLNAVLEDSPVPDREAARLLSIFEPDELADLVGVSTSSLRRYARGDREPSPEVAMRLHFLALVVGDLAGAYDDLGIRAWFRRRRALLGDRVPRDLLRGEWLPEDDDPSSVRELAAALTAPNAT